MTWALDTDLDGFIDYLAFLTRGGASVAGTVMDLLDGNFVCQTRSAAYTADSAYAITLDPACVGNPGSLRWGAFTVYGTDASDPDAPVAFDFAPTTHPTRDRSTCRSAPTTARGTGS